MLRNVCRNESRAGATVSGYWEWLNNATYEGDTTIRHITYDFWGYNVSLSGLENFRCCNHYSLIQVGGLRLEVAIQKGSVGKNISYFNRETAEEAVNYKIAKITQEIPDPSKFLVPKICW